MTARTFLPRKTNNGNIDRPALCYAGRQSHTTAQESFDASRRIEEAGALASRVRVVITRQNSSWLRNIRPNTRKNARDAWAKVHEIIGKKAIHDAPGADGITAQVPYSTTTMLPSRQIEATESRCRSRQHRVNVTVSQR